MLIEVSEPSQAGEARRHAMAFAEELHMGETRGGKIALATAEMATNLVKHAGKGHILIQRVQQNGQSGLRVMSVDKGPGIADIGRALADGHSTAGSMGTGLGAIKRASDSFHLYSAPGCGTVIDAEFWQQKHVPANLPVEVAVVSEPIHGEQACGDGWGIRETAGGLLVMVVDGSGHGILASEAAREAERVFAGAKTDSLLEIIDDVHAALRKTRGAALSIARINVEKGLLSFAGIGNVSASIVTNGTSRGMVCHNGIVGQQMQRVQEFTYPWEPGSTLVMHSDGLLTRWDLDHCPGIWNKPPSVIAALLHRDFCRGRDDVTVLVAKAART